MIRIFAFLLVLLVNFQLNAQETDFSKVDQEILAIPDRKIKSANDLADFINQNYTTDEEKVRAMYTWIAVKLDYDPSRIGRNPKETREDRINDAIIKRNAVCQGYSELFEELCELAGIESHVIAGITKSGGATSTQYAHAWVSAKVNGEWYLFDPTWGAGYMAHSRFVKDFKDNFFMVHPDRMIRTHLPFDLIFQFKEHPVTAHQFLLGDFSGNQDVSYNFHDSVDVYSNMSTRKQFIAAARRIEQNGLASKLIEQELDFHNRVIAAFQRDEMVGRYNNAVDNYNEGIRALNTYLDYRQKNFSPAKNDIEIAEMLKLASEKFTVAKETLQKLEADDFSNKKTYSPLISNVDKVMNKVSQEQSFLSKYMISDSSVRKDMLK